MKYRAIVYFEAESDITTMEKLLTITGPVPLLLTLPEIFNRVVIEYQPESEENENEIERQRRHNSVSH